MGLLEDGPNGKVASAGACLMRGKPIHIAIVLLLALSLFGCSPAVTMSSGQAEQDSLAGQAVPLTPDSAKRLLKSGEAGLIPQPTAAAPFAPGLLPFVRSKPKAVVPFPVVLNRTVQAYVDSYVAQPQGLKRSFRRSQPYLSEMVNVLRSEGLPPDLVYLAFAESAFDDKGAGPWQLNKETARQFGLTIDRWVDQRRDPIESTRAAAEYLATLHDETDHDWRMTLVAWNNGDARLDHYLQLQDTTYERLMSRLPRRTRSLMNRFMAVAVIAHHTEEYGIEPAAYDESPHYHLVAVNGGTPLSELAQRLHLSLIALHSLNPALLRDRTPPNADRYQLRVPDDQLETRLLEEF
jgi:Transglycosylase SLT domain